MTVRTMYDSVTATDIPLSAGMVAGYIDGHYAWSKADWNRFPLASHVRIATRPGTPDGDVLDVETGDATPAQARLWVIDRQAHGYHRPTLYYPQSWRDTVTKACHGLEFDRWEAHYTGHVPPQPAGVVAVQYSNANTSGGHYDLSAVWDDSWPHRTAAPTPLPGGFLSMLTDQQQAELYAWAKEDHITLLRIKAVLEIPDSEPSTSPVINRLLAASGATPGDIVKALREAKLSLG